MTTTRQNKQQDDITASIQDSKDEKSTNNLPEDVKYLIVDGLKFTLTAKDYDKVNAVKNFMVDSLLIRVLEKMTLVPAERVQPISDMNESARGILLSDLLEELHFSQVQSTEEESEEDVKYITIPPGESFRMFMMFTPKNPDVATQLEIQKETKVNTTPAFAKQ